MRQETDYYETPVMIRQEDRLNLGNTYAEPISTATLLESPSELTIELAIPDAAVGNCNINLEEGRLFVSAKGVLGLEIDLEYIARTAFSHGLLYRLFVSLGWHSGDSIHVTCNHRILTIHIPKKDLLQPFVSEIGIN